MTLSEWESPLGRMLLASAGLGRVRALAFAERASRLHRKRWLLEHERAIQPQVAQAETAPLF